MVSQPRHNLPNDGSAFLRNLPFLLLEVTAPATILALGHLPKVIFGFNMFLSALPVANELATIHFLQLICVGWMACAGLSLTRNIAGWSAQLSRALFWGCAIATCIHDPILWVATNSLIRHWQGLSSSPQAIMDAAANLPPDTLVSLAHPIGLMSQLLWCGGIALAAISWRSWGNGWLPSLGVVVGMLFVSPFEEWRYIGVFGFGAIAIWWEFQRIGGEWS